MHKDFRVKDKFYRFYYTDTKPVKVSKICQWVDGLLFECAIRDENDIMIDFQLSESRVLHYMYDPRFRVEISEALSDYN